MLIYLLKVTIKNFVRTYFVCLDYPPIKRLLGMKRLKIYATTYNKNLIETLVNTPYFNNNFFYIAKTAN